MLLPLAIGSAYSYRVPEGLELAIGDIVVVPLGTRLMLGCVWPSNDDTRAVDPAKLKAIVRKYEVVPLRPDLVALIKWIADYTVTPPGMVLRLALRHDESPMSGASAPACGSATSAPSASPPPAPG